VAHAVAPQILAIDLGTSGMKAALVAADGTVTGWAEQPVPLQVLPGGGAEQDPRAWWKALAVVVADLGRAHPGHLAAVTTICSSTQGEGTIAVDAAGEPLTQCISWLDMRGAANLRRQFGGFPALGGVSLRRILRWLRLTGGMPSMTGKDPAAHMLLVRDQLPEVYARTATFLNVLDWINLKLTGRTVATVDSILTSWVTDNRRAGRIRYSPALVADSGIDRSKLPPIVACTDVIGTLSPSAASFLGLPASIQVMAEVLQKCFASFVALDAARMDRTSVWHVLGRAVGHYVTRRPWSPTTEFVPRRKTILRQEVVHDISRDSDLVHPWLLSPGRAPNGKIFHAWQLLFPAEYYNPLGSESDPEQVTPLFSQPLLELAMRIPTWLLTLGGWDRAMARRAFEQDLPRRIVTRQTKGGQEEHAKSILVRNITFARELLLDGHLVREQLLERNQLAEALAPGPTQLLGGNAELFDCLGAEAWARKWCSQ